MKKIIAISIILASILAFTSCDISDEVNAAPEEVASQEETIVNEEKIYQSTKSNIIANTVSYVGNVSDLNIHMTLNYYEDNRIEGSYYYDNYGQEIQLVGEIVGDEVTLYTPDGNEEFVGRLTNNTINGELKSEDRVLPFSVALDNETYGKSIKSNIVKGKEYIFYIGNHGYNSSIYRCKLDGSENVKLADSGSSKSVDIVDNKVYYINTDMKLSRMDKNGENKEVIFDDIESIYDFIIYKDRIYFDNSAQVVLDKTTPCKLLSVDLKGGDYKEVKLPQYTFSYDERTTKDYSIKYIYKNNVIVESLETGADADIYKVGLNGIAPQPTGKLGEVVGAANDKLYYMGVNSPYLYSRGIAASASEYDNSIFTGADIYKNGESEDENYTMNDKFIVYNYTTADDDYHNISVLDLNGNVLNEIKVEKTQNRADGQYEYLSPMIIDDYIYFTVSRGYNKTGYLARVEILGSEPELLTTFK